MALVVSVYSAPTDTVTVDGKQLTTSETAALHFIAERVIPNLPGRSKDEKIEAAAHVVWWSMKEGVISDWNFKRLAQKKQGNIHAFSLCTTDSDDKLLDPLEECYEGKAWQVGAAAVQVYTVPGYAVRQEKRALEKVNQCWHAKPRTIEDVLSEAAQLAGLTEEQRYGCQSQIGAASHKLAFAAPRYRVRHGVRVRGHAGMFFGASHP